MAETRITNVMAIDYVLNNVEELPEEIREKLLKIKASYENKSGNRKPTARQEENVGVKENLLAVLKDAGVGMTVTDILAADKENLDGVTCQRASVLLKQMIADKTVEKYIEKKKSYFKAI